ncbi:phosphotransferase [Kribbella sp. NPDC050241]|uniref:phosphotransferase n=1 Tax=Kribbella sp. NPDC050241 TaxID=3364115 RepID=UPI0037A2EFC7
MKGWERVTIGESGADVFRRGDVFAKRCGADGVRALRDERDRVEWLAGTAIPGATVVDWVESADSACLMTTAVPGVPGDSLAVEDRVRAMASLGRVLRELHSLTGCPFERPLASVVALAEDVVRRGAVNPAFLTDEWRKLEPAELLERVVAESPYIESVQELVVCHGDLCLPNVLFDPSTLEVTGLIDLGRLGITDRYLDLALATIQIHDEWSTDPAPFLTSYGLPHPDQRRLDFHRLLDPLTWADGPYC